MGPFSDTVYTAGVWRVFPQVRMSDGPENVTLSVVNECPNALLPSGDLQKNFILPIMTPLIGWNITNGDEGLAE